MEQLCSLKEDGNANRLHGTGIAPRDLSTTMEVNQTFEEEEVPNKDNNDDNIIIATSEENLPSSDEDKSSASLIQSLLQENEALKQENHELRNRIEQLENFHLSESHDKGKVVPAITPSQNEEKQAPPQQNETDSTARKPEIDITLANLQTMSCLSPDVLRFFECFAKYSYDNDAAKQLRRLQWVALDSNGSGHVSLAETTRWIKSALYQMTKNRDEGERLYRLFYPCYIQAFTDAADAGIDRKIKGASKSTEDDYIQKGEFRLLASYLCIYALMLETFAILDGTRAVAPASQSVFRADKKVKTPPKQTTSRGSAGALSNISGDRRITPEEWNQRYSTLGQTPFVALNSILNSPDLARNAFAEMDADGKGAVLMNEYCRWLKAKEIANQTSFGRLLQIGDSFK